MNAPGDLPPDTPERPAGSELKEAFEAVSERLPAERDRIVASIRVWMLATLAGLFLGFSVLIVIAARLPASPALAPIVINLPAAPAAPC